MTIDIKHILLPDKRLIIASTLLCLLLASPILATKSLASDALSATDCRTLTRRLASDDPNVRRRTALEMDALGQDALPPLIVAYRTGDAVERRGAIIGYALLPQPALAQDFMMSALSDPDAVTRGLTAQALALTGAPVAHRLAPLLSYEDEQIRNAAALALRLMGEKAVPALIKALETDDDFGRAKAAWLLGRIGKEAVPAIPRLIAALDAEDDRAMHVIAEAIDLIGAPPATALHHLRLIGIGHSLHSGRIGSQAAPTLVRLLTRPGTPLAQLAFRTLASIGGDAAPALREAVLSGTAGQRIAAALLLIEIDPEAVHTLPEDVRSTLAGAGRKPQQ